MQQQQPLFAPSAKAFASEPNFGVRGFRSLQQQERSGSLDLTNPNPQSEQTGAATFSSHELTDEQEEAILRQRADHWNTMRKKQQADIARKINAVDAAKFLLIAYLVRKLVHAMGLKIRIVAPALALIAFVKMVWENRATARTMPYNPASPPSWPILGQIGIIAQVLSKGGFAFQIQQAKAGGFVSSEAVMFGKTNDFTLMDPVDRRHMLRTNWKNYSKNLPDGSGFQENFADVMGRGIFAVDGDEWADQRKVASHMFSANGLKLKMERSFCEHGDKLVRLLQPHLGKELNFQDMMANLTFETICDIAFGMSPGSMEAGFDRGRKIDFLLQFDRAQQNSALRFILPMPVWKLMRYLNVGSERQLREDGSNLRAYVRKIVQNHKETDDNLLTLYLKTGRQTGKTFMMEEDYLIDTILNFMIAGRDTTSCLLTNMFKLMTPEVERRMLEELDRVVGRSAVGVSWDHIRELRYCSAVFNEVLRLYPPVGFDTRSVVADDVFPSGIRVKAGNKVGIPMVAIGRDPHLFERPDEFLPERWIIDPTKPTNRPDELVFPVFWGGPRLCLGKDMARLEALNIAYTLLKNFTFEVLPHNERMVNGPVLFYEEGLPVKIHARKE